MRRTRRYHLDPDYADVTLTPDSLKLYAGRADPGKCGTPPDAEIAAMPEGSVLDWPAQAPRTRPAALNDRKITAFALELLPRISRGRAWMRFPRRVSCAGYQWPDRRCPAA